MTHGKKAILIFCLIQNMTMHCFSHQSSEKERERERERENSSTVTCKKHRQCYLVWDVGGVGFMGGGITIYTNPEDVTYHTYVSFYCQSGHGGVRCMLEQLSYHMILNKRGMRFKYTDILFRL